MGIHFADQYSLLHLATGIIAYFFDINLAVWFVLHGLFEWVENTETGVHIIDTYFFFWPGGKRAPDAIINRFGDHLFAMIGWLLAYAIDTMGRRRHWYVQPSR